MFDAKTTSDVATQAMDLLQKAGSELYRQAQHIAPQVWAMAYRQTIIDGIKYTLLFLVGFLPLYCGIVTLRKAKEWFRQEKDAFGWVMVTILLFVVAGLILANSADSAINYLGNPNYWTLAKLLSMAHGHF